MHYAYTMLIYVLSTALIHILRWKKVQLVTSLPNEVEAYTTSHNKYVYATVKNIESYFEKEYDYRK